MDGWTEADGPFPAAFSDLNDTAQKLRVGTEARKMLGPGTWLWASAAWGHRLNDGTTEFTGTLIDVFTVEVPAQTISENWLELGAGIRFSAGEASAITASAGGSMFGSYEPTFQARIGFTQRL